MSQFCVLGLFSRDCIAGGLLSRTKRPYRRHQNRIQSARGDEVYNCRALNASAFNPPNYTAKNVITSLSLHYFTTSTAERSSKLHPAVPSTSILSVTRILPSIPFHPETTTTNHVLLRQTLLPQRRRRQRQRLDPRKRCRRRKREQPPVPAPPCVVDRAAESRAAGAVEPQDHLRPTPQPEPQCGPEPGELRVYLCGDGVVRAEEGDGDTGFGEEVSSPLRLWDVFYTRCDWDCRVTAS